ncbi:MAG: hypothetical protein AAGB32_05605 [Pseudomonadota bacterium]
MMRSKLRGALVAEFEFTVGEPFSFPCVLDESPDWLTMIDDDQGESVCLYVANTFGLQNPDDNLKKFSAGKSIATEEREVLKPEMAVCPLFNHAQEDIGKNSTVTITQADENDNCILISTDSVPCAVVTLPDSETGVPKVESLFEVEDQGSDYTRILMPFLTNITPPSGPLN